MGKYEEDLQSSEIEEQWVTDFYYKCFPNIVSINSVPKGYLQYSGVDKIITQKDNYKIYIEEKVRFEDYGDILLEEYSNWEKKTPGWITDESKITDFIAYIIIPTKKIWLINFRKLKILWDDKYPEWLKKYKRKVATTYEKGSIRKTTSNIPVPIEELEAAFLRTNQSGSNNQNRQLGLF